MSNDGKKDNATCFVVMPISDVTGYEDGHFQRVYENLIKPACIKAGFSPIRADEVQNTNDIMIDILRRILDTKLVVGDLSSRNPNVLYELGIRQAFNRPVVLLKDRRTERIFDIQGLRTLEYDESLRVDLVSRDRAKIKITLEETLAKHGEGVNSLIHLMGIKEAELKASTEISSETSLILSALKDLSSRIYKLEQKETKSPPDDTIQHARFLTLPSGERVTRGTPVLDRAGGASIGRLLDIEEDKIIVGKSGRVVVYDPDSPIYKSITTFPF